MAISSASGSGATGAEAAWTDTGALCDAACAGRRAAGDARVVVVSGSRGATERDDRIAIAMAIAHEGNSRLLTTLLTRITPAPLVRSPDHVTNTMSTCGSGCMIDIPGPSDMRKQILSANIRR
jgi:hypothetical protein